MEYPERLPAAQEGEQFPMRDIDDVHRNGMVDLWFDAIEEYVPPRLFNYVLARSRPSSKDGMIVYDNYVAALKLCSAWDSTAIGEDKYSVLGYITARAFEVDTGLLPKWTTDMTQELAQMQREQRDAIAYGRVAINGMHVSHPTLYKHYERLYVHSKKTFGFDNEEEGGYFQAGLVLPYMITVADQLKQQTLDKKISGVVLGSRQQLESMNFADIFTTESE